MSKYTEKRAEQGFTLIELLIAIVVVGILTAVAIVGIASLTNNGKTSACTASADAAKAAQAVYYSNSHGTYPANLMALTSGATPVLEVSAGVTAPALGTENVMTTGTGGWTLTATPHAGAALTFACT